MVWVLVIAGCTRSLDPAPAPPIAPALPPPAGIDPEDDLSGLVDWPCFGGTGGCAATGPHIDGTCCTWGDGFEAVGQAWWNEVVDVVTDGVDLVACGGFGAGFGSLADPGAVGLSQVGSAGRCQRAALGPVADDGSRLVWLAHHGDSWVDLPALWTFRHIGGGHFEEVDVLQDTEVLFEGLAWHDDHLFVAAHASGLRVYDTSADVPDLVATLGGFENAFLVEIAAPHAYVIDGSLLQVVDISLPAEPWTVETVQLASRARDLALDGDRIFVAQGSDGVEVLDRGDPARPASVGRIPVVGSAQSVDADGGLVAVAAWSHTALYDGATLRLLGTERHTAHFEQDLGVALHDGLAITAEWNGLHLTRYREGYVASDIWADTEMLTYVADESSPDLVRIQNRGPLNLLLTIGTDDAAFRPDVRELRLLPGQEAPVRVDYAPPAVDVSSRLELWSNDPDVIHQPLEVLLQTTASDQLSEGDVLTEAFAFLDPSGQDDLENLRGHVVVLAYFALF